MTQTYILQLLPSILKHDNVHLLPLIITLQRRLSWRLSGLFFNGGYPGRLTGPLTAISACLLLTLILPFDPCPYSLPCTTGLTPDDLHLGSPSSPASELYHCSHSPGHDEQ